MLETLARLEVPGVHLDLGHVGVFRLLAAQARLGPRQEVELLEAMQRKDGDDVARALEQVCDAAARERIAALVDLNGGTEVLGAARELLAGAGPAVAGCLDALAALVDALVASGTAPPLHLDLAELRGYRYHTGVVFAAFVPGLGQEIARGGRYDDIGEAFGAARPATGFSTDLKTLVSLSPAATAAQPSVVRAPWSTDPGLRARVAALRAEGARVVFALPGEKVPAARSGRRLEQHRGTWVVVGDDGEQARA